jgi:hypothetical protein
MLTRSIRDNPGTPAELAGFGSIKVWPDGS